MMPEMAAVLDAARYLLAHTDVIGRWEAPLKEAVDALDAKLHSAGAEPTMEEQDREYGEVVESDQILSVKTGRWYEVTRTVTDGKGKVKINIKGAPQPIVRGVKEPVRVKRGITGDAMDIMEVLWSAQTRPNDPAPKGVGPMLGEREEDND